MIFYRTVLRDSYETPWRKVPNAKTLKEGVAYVHRVLAPMSLGLGWQVGCLTPPNTEPQVRREISNSKK